MGVILSKRCGMLGGLMNLLSLCLKPFGGRTDNSGSTGGNNNNNFNGDFVKDGLLWFRDTGKYASGEFSMAVVQANMVLEDQSQIESGPFGTFVGVYDGHGGPEAARYVCDHLFRHFQGLCFESFDLVSFCLCEVVIVMKRCDLFGELSCCKLGIVINTDASIRLA